jgi:hypothetical protein
MKPYWRAESRRFEEYEARIGWLESRVGEAWTGRFVPKAATPTSVAAPEIVEAGPAPAPGVDWTTFAASFEAALGEADAALRAVARCASTRLGRAFGCGAERGLGDGFCGSAVCPTCAEARTAAAHEAARGWPSFVLVADLPIKARAWRLPAQAKVVAAREAWSKAGAPFGVEALPRAVTSTEGVRLFAAIEDKDADVVARSIEKAVGKRHAGATVRAVPRDQARDLLAEALTIEARRFAELVEQDLRQGEDLARKATRWVSAARARQGDARRATVSGGKAGLRVPDGKPTFAPATCPTHGAGCAEVGSVIRSHAGEPLSHGKPLPARPTRQAVAKVALAPAAPAKTRAAA